MGESKIKMSNNLKKMKENEEKAFFVPAGDLEDDNNKMVSSSVEKIKNDETFLDNITSGISYRFNENYIVTEGGRIITTVEKLKEMVDNNYNIIKYQIIGEVNNSTLVEVEFERVEEKMNTHHR